MDFLFIFDIIKALQLFKMLSTHSEKKLANRKLEIACMRGDSFMFSCALSEGASIGYKSGAHFTTACRMGFLPIVEMFVLDPTFITKGKKYKKTLTNPSFHDGLLYAISNNKIDVVDFLLSNERYQKIGDIQSIVLDGIKYACKSQHHTMVQFILINYQPDTISLNQHYKQWDSETQDFFDKLFLETNLIKKLENKQEKKGMKI